jgi:hypothetical protein
MGFFFIQNFFFRTTRVRILIFFCRTKRNFFSQKLTLDYMTKTLNQIFFPPPKSEYFFSNMNGWLVTCSKIFLHIVNARWVCLLIHIWIAVSSSKIIPFRLVPRYQTSTIMIYRKRTILISLFALQNFSVGISKQYRAFAPHKNTWSATASPTYSFANDKFK